MANETVKNFLRFFFILSIVYDNNKYFDLFFSSFQTSIQLFNPDVVIILGDVFDEGNWVDQKGFNEYVERFYSIFTVPSATKVYAVHGNHDVNFHYRMHSYLISRFNQAFNTSGVRIIRESKTTLAGVKRAINFVTLNSMALERDGCALCNEAEYEIKSIKKRLEKLKQIQKYSNPIILQHFPTFRENDDKCIETNSINHDKYREKWETLSKDATKFIADNLNPRLYLSGHSHHYCQLKNSQNTEEYTVASFNWRNLNNPSFLLAIFTPEDFTLSLCELPKETTVFTCYILGIIFSLILVIFHRRKCKLNFKKLI